MPAPKPTRKPPAKPARKPARKPRRAARASSAPANKADIDALRVELLAALQHAAWIASLPSESIDAETLAAIQAARADPTPRISLEDYERERGL